MAIRHSDESFIMRDVMPTLYKVESLLRALDKVDSLRSGESESSPLTDELERVLDEIVLRVHKQGSFTWDRDQARLGEIREDRCDHTAKTKVRVQRKTGELIHRTRCSRCLKVLGEVPIETAA